MPARAAAATHSQLILRETQLAEPKPVSSEPPAESAALLAQERLGRLEARLASRLAVPPLQEQEERRSELQTTGEPVLQA